MPKYFSNLFSFFLFFKSTAESSAFFRENCRLFCVFGHLHEYGLVIATENEELRAELMERQGMVGNL